MSAAKMPRTRRVSLDGHGCFTWGGDCFPVSVSFYLLFVTVRRLNPARASYHHVHANMSPPLGLIQIASSKIARRDWWVSLGHRKGLSGGSSETKGPERRKR